VTAVPADLAANPRLDRWISVLPDGRVELRVGKVEIGQGIGAALALIAAEELDVPPARIRVVAGDTAVCPDELWTSASISVQAGGAAVRHAAAEVRALFAAAAALRLNAAPEEIEVADGVFRASGRERGIGYGELAAAVRLDRAPSPGARTKPASAYAVVGRAPERPDLEERIRGAGFVHDVAVPGMLHGRVLRPPRPGARLAGIDVEALRALPGVEAVVVDGSFVGIAARREEQAVRAAEKAAAAAAWTGGAPLPPGSASPRDVLDGRPSVRRVVAGDPDGAPLPDGVRVRVSASRPFLAHASVGLCCALAAPADGGLTVWTHSQGVFPLRAGIARVLGLPVEAVRVVHAPGAGCYGHNGADDVALDAALLARATGRPVRVLWTRAQEIADAPLGSAMAVDVEAVLGPDGRVAAWSQRVRSFTHLTRPGWGDGVNLLSAWLLAEPFAPSATADPGQVPHGGGGDRNAVPLYAFPRTDVAYDLVLDAPFRTSALRSLGAFANVLAIEAAMDEMAEAAGRDPVAFRLDHLDDPRARAVIEAAARLAGPPPRHGDAAAGRGYGFARYKNTGAYCAVAVDVEVDREVRVRRVAAAVDAGLAVDPDGVRNQVEGGIVQAVSWTLTEEVRVEGDGLRLASWDDYPILGFGEVPEIDVDVLDRRDDPPLGVGECTMGPVAGAISNALKAALGVRLADTPFTRDRVLAAIG